MDRKKSQYSNCGSIVNNERVGNFVFQHSSSDERKDTIIQSLWTKPCGGCIKDMMYLAALSLAYAHNSGYNVNMHTDSYGAELLKDFGYDNLLTTLDKIPDSVPTLLFAAGKFYALQAEGNTGKVHIDIDVFLKKPGVLDRFYRNPKVDAICQMEEDMSLVDHRDIIQHMFVMGYPATTRPNWHGSMNTGIIGFHNPELAKKYIDNYFEALGIYQADKFEQYRKENKDANLFFDFVLEQIELSFLSTGYNVYTLLPTKNCCFVADKIGYQHLQGTQKWSEEYKNIIKKILMVKDQRLFDVLRRKLNE